MSDEQLPESVPLEYAGKWLAWTPDAMRIAGVGDTPEEALAAAIRAGVNDVVYEWAPPDVALVIGTHGVRALLGWLTMWVY